MTQAFVIRKRTILALSCLAQFMVILDVSIVNVALPSIQKDLHYSASGLGWIVSAYAICFAGFLLLGGRIADVIGGRRAYELGMLVFAGASIAAGAAHTDTMLTIARSVQGLGGALLAPVSLSLIMTTFREGIWRHKALGIWTSMVALGGASGGVLGGILTDIASWRWIFLINIPLGVIGLVGSRIILTKLPASSRRRPRLDWIGSISATAGMALFVAGILGAQEHEWLSERTLGLLLSGIILIVFFVVAQAKFVKEPLMPLRLFKVRTLVASLTTMLLVGGAFFGMWFFLSLYVQEVLGYSPLRTGFAFVPLSIFSVLGSIISSKMITKVGARSVLTAGTVCATVGFAGLSFLHVSGSYFPMVIVPSVVLTFGLGLSMTPLATVASDGVHYADAGIVSGLLNCSRQIGVAIWLAIMATIAAQHTERMQKAGSSLQAAVTSSYALVFAISAAMCALATVIAFLLLPRRMDTAS